MVDQETKAEILKLFKEFDKDQNGVLDKNEIKYAIREMNSHLELLGLELSNTDINDMIKRSDKNSDGKIQIEEFVNLI